MDRTALVYYNDIPAGRLTQGENVYTFEYEDTYLKDAGLPAISLSFPKQKEAFTAQVLFPFFYGLLSEGENKIIQCRRLKIDENDHFTLLITTAGSDTIGAVTVREME